MNISFAPARSFDDGAVTKVKEEDEIVNKYAYVLFYRRNVFT